MKRSLFLLLYISAVLFFSGKAVAGTIVTYPLPSCYTVSSQATITADGTTVPLISNVATALYDYTEFSHSGTTTVVITANANITSYSISPLKNNTSGTVSGKTLTFTITGSKYVIVTINSLRKIVIAADALETNAPASSGTGIYNITASPYNADKTGVVLATTAVQNAINAANTAGGGIVYVPAGVFTCGNIVLKSNVSLYLAGGSVIRASNDTLKFTTFFRKNSVSRNGTWFVYTQTGATNVKIYGRGTIDGNGDYLRNSKNYLTDIVVPMACSNFNMTGIILRDGGSWGFIPTRSDHITVVDTKHFSENNSDFEDDAIDVQESQHVILNHLIAISEDDSYSTKTWSAGTDISSNWPGSPEALDDVNLLNCIAWSRTATFKIGNGQDEAQSNITVKNFVSYSSSRAIAFNPAYGTASCTNLLIDTVDIEGYNPRAFNSNQWLDVNVLGNTPMINSVIRNVNIRNLGTSASNLYGHNATGLVNGLTFQNIHVPGQTAPASTLAQMNITKVNGFIQNIQILPLVASSNLALHKPTSVSSLFAANNIASSATDGIPATRWGSQYSDPQWLAVDLGKTYNISKVIISWETAMGKNFQIQTSNDSLTWTTIKTITGNTVTADTISGLSGSGRYIRMYGTSRATIYGYSIYEFEVYGSLPAGVVTSAVQGPAFSTAAATTTNTPVVHTALSPNGDGVNDVLTVDNIERYPDNKLTIMNANGTKVYEVSRFNNHTKTFDGHSNITGAMQNAGTYYYRLQYRYNGVMQNKTGYIVIKY